MNSVFQILTTITYFASPYGYIRVVQDPSRVLVHLEDCREEALRKAELLFWAGTISASRWDASSVHRATLDMGT